MHEHCKKHEIDFDPARGCPFCLLASAKPLPRPPPPQVACPKITGQKS